jgi:NhaA family Na+:H+ antiporter
MPTNVLLSIKRLLGEERISGLLLIFATILALAWANSPLAASYVTVKETTFRIGFGEWSVDKSLHHWINDGLMTIFFLLIGLEIRQELTKGILSTPGKAMLTVAAAIGGMVLPAITYIAFNCCDVAAMRGWGIPVATDIAFVIGLIGLLGARVPVGLKIFLMAMAVVDDMGAILVIALFYSHALDSNYLVWASVILVLAFVYGWRNGRSIIMFSVLGVVLWYFMLKSGVHATLTGVLLAMVVPGKPEMDPDALIDNTKAWMHDQLPAKGVDKAASQLKSLATTVESPAHRLEDAIAPWVLFGIMPIFALMNAGVAITSETNMFTGVTLGVALGLLLGKPVGIIGATWLATRIGAQMPEHVNWQGIIGVSVLAGVGFTMSLFIAELAFGGRMLIDQAKIGILTASFVAGIVGLVVLRSTLSPPAPEVVRETG